MISVTPFTRSYVSAQRTKIIRTAIIAALAFAAFAIAISQLAGVTGDMLSASVMGLAGLATVLAVLAPRARGRA